MWRDSLPESICPVPTEGLIVAEQYLENNHESPHIRLLQESNKYRKFHRKYPHMTLFKTTEEQILRLIRISNDKKLTIEQIWQHLNELYDMKALVYLILYLFFKFNHKN